MTPPVKRTPGKAKVTRRPATRRGKAGTPAGAGPRAARRADRPLWIVLIVLAVLDVVLAAVVVLR